MSPKRKSPANWPAIALSVGALLPADKMHPAVRAWVDQSKARGPWLVALSGGVDSLALLFFLWAHWPERRDRLRVLHFNHRLRGRESTADEKFCGKVCSALDLSLRIGRWTGFHRGASEAACREARHAFFVREMKRYRSRVLWLAHQQDDVAESMLMRLSRGSGAGGLSAPRPVQSAAGGRTHLRPLLNLKKSELIAALKTAGGKWAEDSSNAGETHFRNRIRHHVLPAWLTSVSGRDAFAGAALSRELLEEDDLALERWAREFVLLRERQLDVRALKKVPRAVARRALHQWLLLARPETDLSRQGFALLLAAVERGRPTRFSLGTKGFAIISDGKMFVGKR